MMVRGCENKIHFRVLITRISTVSSAVWFYAWAGSETSLIPSPMLFFYFCRSKFLMYVIFLSSKGLLLMTLVARKKIPWFCLSSSLSLLKDNCLGHKILGWWVLFLFLFSCLNTLNILLNSLLVDIAEEKSDVILIFAPVHIKCFISLQFLSRLFFFF